MSTDVSNQSWWSFADEMERREKISDDLETLLANATLEIGTYLDKILDGVVHEGAFCGERAKRKIRDILTDEIYIPVVMGKK